LSGLKNYWKIKTNSLTKLSKYTNTIKKLSNVHKKVIIIFSYGPEQNLAVL